MKLKQTQSKTKEDELFMTDMKWTLIHEKIKLHLPISVEQRNYYLESLKSKKGKGLQCTDCLPVRPLNGHPSYRGSLVHSRTDVPKGYIYFMNEKYWTDK